MAPQTCTKNTQTLALTRPNRISPSYKRRRNDHCQSWWHRPLYSSDILLASPHPRARRLPHLRGPCRRSSTRRWAQSLGYAQWWTLRQWQLPHSHRHQSRTPRYCKTNPTRMVSRRNRPNYEQNGCNLTRQLRRPICRKRQYINMHSHHQSSLEQSPCIQDNSR